MGEGAEGGTQQAGDKGGGRLRFAAIHGLLRTLFDEEHQDARRSREAKPPPPADALDGLISLNCVTTSGSARERDRWGEPPPPPPTGLP